MLTLHQYPRPHHLEGSRFRPGDEDHQGVPFTELAGLPLLPVPVLHSGPAPAPEHVRALIGPSLGKGPEWREHLIEAAGAAGRQAGRALEETDRSDLMEGLYVKVEEAGRVAARYK